MGDIGVARLTHWARWGTAAVAASFAADAAAQCEPQWLPGTAATWTSSHPLAIGTWDPDDTGALPAQLVIGGDFTTAGGEIVNRVARWDGAAWQPFGAGLDNAVRCIATWDPDGPGGSSPLLVVAGDFLNSGGSPVSRIAWWDGVEWRPLGMGVDGPVLALTSWDPDGPGPASPLLIAGGEFVNAGSVPAQRIAAWNGTEWSALGSGLSGGTSPWVKDLTTWDPDGPGPLDEVLCAGGRFTSAGGMTANQVAAWNGEGWEPLLAGLTAQPYGYVNALVSWDPDGTGPATPRLVWGGAIGIADGGPNEYIGVWDGTRWSALATTLGSIVQDLAVADLDGPGPLPDRLIAVGRLPDAGRTPTVMSWTGAGWSDVDSRSSFSVQAAGVLDPDGDGPRAAQLIIAGDFFGLGSSSVSSLARWEDDCWRGFGSFLSGTSASVLALGVADPDADGPLPEQIIAGGLFDQSTNGLARWDGLEWHPFLPLLKVGSSVQCVTNWDPDGAGPDKPVLIVGGRFEKAGSLTTNSVAAWDGSGWRALATGVQGTNAYVADLTPWDPDGDGPQSPLLIAAGNFDTAGGVSAREIAAWNGLGWAALGPGVNGDISCLMTWDFDGAGPQPERLIAAGSFTVIGSSPPIQHIAVWDGQTWSAISAPPGRVYDMVAYDPDGAGPALADLIATGGPTLSGFVARWNGLGWATIGAMNGYGGRLATWDPDGSGPGGARLVVGGRFTMINSQSVNRIAQWDGGGWLPLGTGLQGGSPGSVSAIVAWDLDGNGPDGEHLFVGGSFDRAGEQAAASFAHWGPGTPWFADQPTDRDAEVGETVSFIATPAAGQETLGPAAFRWRHNGVPIFDGPSTGGTIITGAATTTLFLMNVGPTNLGDYECQMTTPCGTTTSQPATLAVAGCPADLNDDGVVDFADYLEFLNLYDALDPRADLSGDGVIDFGDYLEFLNHYDAGC